MKAETLDYHAPRVIKANRAYGLKADHVTAEDLFDDAGVTEYDRFGPVIDGLRSDERKARIENLIDRQGWLLRAISKLNGGRLVDVIEVPGGSLELVNTTARARIAQLAAEHDIEPIKQREY